MANLVMMAATMLAAEHEIRELFTVSDWKSRPPRRLFFRAVYVRRRADSSDVLDTALESAQASSQSERYLTAEPMRM
jgi:hypothetical protein